jgi:kynurenine formamidase
MSKKTPFERYEEYVQKLEQEGRRFPVNQHGTVNHAKIAEDSGTRRQWYTESANKKFGPDNKALDAIMKADVKRIGTDIVAPKDPDEELSKIADNRSREANQLRQMLEQKTKENEQLRTDNQILREKIRVLENSVSEAENSAEEMLDSGRRFSL